MSGETQMPGSLPDRNETVTAYPRNSAIHLLFEQQVALKPHSVALEFEDQSLCYQELNERANRVAHLLRGAASTEARLSAFASSDRRSSS